MSADSSRRIVFFAHESPYRLPPLWKMSVQAPTFVEDGRLRRIDVLRTVVSEDPATEGDHLSAESLDREHDATPKAVVRLPTSLAPFQQAELEHEVFVESVLERRLAECAPLVRREAEAEALGDLGPDSAALEIRAGLHSDRVIQELRPEPGLSESADLVQGPVRVVLRPAPMTLDDLNAGPRRHEFDGLDEIHPHPLHDEIEDVAGLAASEAFVESLPRNDVEAGRPLLVERAVGLVLATRLLEGDRLPDDVDDVGPGADLVDDLVGDHLPPPRSATVTPAPPSPTPPIRKRRTLSSPERISATRFRRAPVPLPWMILSSGRSSKTA